MNKEEMRIKFEEWHLSLHGSTFEDIEPMPKSESGLEFMYKYLDTQLAWQAWQARQPEIGQLKAEIVDLKNALYECEQGEK